MMVFGLLGIISILYGMLVAAGGGRTRFYIVWMCIGAVLLCFSFYRPFVLLQMLPSFLKIVLIGLCLVGITALIVIETRIVRCFWMNGMQNLDYVIVLGSYVKPDGPSRALKYRLDQAYAYLKENENTVCIVSGGQGSDEHCSEASCMKQYLCSLGIDGDRIIEEDASVNTEENIRFSMHFMKDPDSNAVGIITNDFHLFRAMHIAEKQGIRHVHGISAHSTRFYLVNNAFREFFAVIKDLIKGNMTWR